MRRKLHELAHSRAGDKGDTSILSLIAYRPEDYPLLHEQITAGVVKQHLAGIVNGEVRRFELPHLSALQFVCERSLSGGVTTSLSLDAHGKSLSSALLELEVDVPDV
jgi:RecJ-like exonuclease